MYTKISTATIFSHDIYHYLLKSTIPYVNQLSLDVRSRKDDICVSLFYSVWSRRAGDINYVPRRGEICQFFTFLQQKRIIFRQLKFNAISCLDKIAVKPIKNAEEGDSIFSFLFYTRFLSFKTPPPL
jgi:hypothetical protein